MLNTIRSHKLQKEIYYYTEDIDWSESRAAWTAPGMGSDGEEYDVILDEVGSGYSVRDVRPHNT